MNATTGIDRRVLLATMAAVPALYASLLPTSAPAQTSSGLLPSWNDGAAKQAILEFVRATTDQSRPTYVPPEERIAAFDQDGTLWVEHPMRRGEKRLTPRRTPELPPPVRCRR